MNPKVSVLIPSYNHGRFLADTIKSVLNQSFRDFELIISDDCSVDNTKEIIDSFSDDRIKKVFLTENVGTVRNLNGMISIATGLYIAVIGSDDIWYPSKLEKQVEYLDNNTDIGACFTWADVIDENNQPLDNKQGDIKTDIFDEQNKNQGQWLRRFYDDGNHLCHSGVLIRKSTHDDIGNYNIAYRQLHDYDLWIRLIKKYPIHIIEEKLVGYRRILNSSDCVSSNNVQNTVRLVNENTSIIYNMISTIGCDILKQGFLEKDAPVIGEARCNAEKYRLLKNYSLQGETNYELSNRFLFEHATGEMIDILEKEFGISVGDIYGETSQLNMTYPQFIVTYFQDAERKKETDDLKGQINQLSSSISELQSRLNEINESTSWKITKPIRFFKDVLKDITGDK